MDHNLINIIFAAIQAFTSVLAIVISVLSLIKTNKSMRNANKPYIVVFVKYIRSSKSYLTYLVVKNFGKTGAYIKSIKANPDIYTEWYSKRYKNNPFERFHNQLIAPGQSYASCISIETSVIAELEDKQFKLSVEFTDLNNKFYTETFDIDLNPFYSFDHTYSSPKDSDKLIEAIYSTSNEEIINDL